MKGNTNDGFTLVETLIYTAFLSLLLISLLGLTFQILESVNKVNKRIILEQEANFILRKIEWAISSSENLSPALLHTSGPLTFTRTTAPNTIIFNFDSPNIQTDQGAGFKNLNSSNVAVTALDFYFDNFNKKFSVSFKLNNEPFSYTKYIK